MGECGSLAKNVRAVLSGRRAECRNWFRLMDFAECMRSFIYAANGQDFA